MLVCTRQKRMRLPDTSLDLSFVNDCIPQVSKHKLLGVIFDHNLTWNDQVDSTLSRISSKIYQLNCIKNVIDVHTRKIFYFAYIHPYFLYCSSVWGHTYSSNIKRLSSIQRRAITHVITNFSSDNVSLYRQLSILPFEFR